MQENCEKNLIMWFRPNAKLQRCIKVVEVFIPQHLFFVIADA